MKATKFIVVFLVFILVVSCAMFTHTNVPKWYIDTPEDDDYIYGVGSSESDDLGMAKISAEADARDDIARQFQLKIENIITRSKQAVGSTTQANVTSTASKQIVNITLSNIITDQREVFSRGKKYIVYALAKMPIDPMKEEIKKALEQEEIKKQLNIDANLQNQLYYEIERLDGKKE